VIILYGFVSEILGYTPDKNKKSAESDAGRRLLDLLLRERGVHATSDNIKIGINGKPYFEGMPGLDFNITHSKGFVACILSMGEGRVGIDTELTEIACNDQVIILA
jgi:phosphopantetheinyl transferase